LQGFPNFQRINKICCKKRGLCSVKIVSILKKSYKNIDISTMHFNNACVLSNSVLTPIISCFKFRPCLIKMVILFWSEVCELVSICIDQDIRGRVMILFIQCHDFKCVTCFIFYLINIEDESDYFYHFGMQENSFVETFMCRLCLNHKNWREENLVDTKRR